MPNKTKIRFQNPNFRRKLQEARDYKRYYKKIPETKMGIFLAFLHLDSIFGKTIAFMIFLLFIYFIYAPNFLTVKRVEISGADANAKPTVEADIKEYFKSSRFWPQSNLLLLSKKNLSIYLISKNKAVTQVAYIGKDFPSNLSVKIEQRYDKFLLKNPNGAYVLSNDGFVDKQLALENLSSTNTPYSGLIPILSEKDEQLYQGQRPQDEEYFKNLNQILSLSEKDGRKITAIEIESFEHANVSANFFEGYQIKFDVNSDLPKIFSQLRLLLKQAGEGRISGVKYIDMRVKDRGYVCYKEALCAQEAPVGTTTPAVLN